MQKTFFIKQNNFSGSRKAIHLNQQHPVVLISQNSGKYFSCLRVGKMSFSGLKPEAETEEKQFMFVYEVFNP